MKSVLFVIFMLMLSIQAHATPNVEDVSINGDWPTGKVDVAPVSLYAHTATNVIAPIKVNAGGGFSTSTAPQASIIVSPDANNTYVCNAAVGSTAASSVWQCSYIFVSGSTTTIKWANGSSSYSNVATNPAGLTYS